MPKKQVKFVLISTIDPETGKEKAQFVPQVEDHERLSQKQMDLIDEFSGEFEQREQERIEEEELSSNFPKDHPLYEPPTRDPDSLTEEEIERFTIGGRFPNDGYDYSQHFRNQLAQGHMVINEDYTDPVDIKMESMDEHNENALIRSVGMENNEFVDEETEELIRLNQFVKDKREKLPQYDFENEEEAQKLTRELFEDVDEFDEIDFDDAEDAGEEDFLDDHDAFDNLISELQQDPGTTDEMQEDQKKERAAHLKSILKRKLQHKIPEKLSSEAYEEEKRILDETFDAFFDQYEDQYIGRLDDMEIPEHDMGHNDVRRILSEFQFEQEYDHFRAAVDLTHDTDKPSDRLMRQLKSEAPEGYYVYDKRAKRRLRDTDVDRAQIVPYVQSRIENFTEEEELQETDVVEVKVRDQWDCESIVSTYTNTTNHPATVEEVLTDKQKAKKKRIELSKKNGVPLGVFDTLPQPTKKFNEKKESGIGINLGTKRSKKESKEEKRLRKKLQKELKRERRETKKTMKGAFKSEELQQRKLDSLPETRRKVRFHF